MAKPVFVDGHIIRGDILSVCAAGGGGFGPPHQRDPERIRHDMEAGLVSPEAAERHYGWRG